MKKEYTDKKFCVYGLISTLDDKVFYIGKGKKYRPSDNIATARKKKRFYLHRKIRKIWELGGDVYWKLLFETDDEQEAFSKEIELIKAYGRENLTNLTDGGEGSTGYKPTKETIEKVRQSNMGRKLSPETIARRQQTRKDRNIPPWNKNKKMNDEFRKKCAKGGLDKIPWNKGLKISQEIKDKISRRQKEIGRPMSEYNKLRIKESTLGIPKTQEHRDNLSKVKSKAVRCIETKEIFRNCKFAGEKYYVCGNAIRQAIINKGKSAKYHWEWVNE